MEGRKVCQQRPDWTTFQETSFQATIFAPSPLQKESFFTKSECRRFSSFPVSLLCFCFLLTRSELDVRRVNDRREVVSGSGTCESVNVNALRRCRRNWKPESFQFQVRHFRYRNDRSWIFRVRNDTAIRCRSIERIRKVEVWQELDRLRRLQIRMKARVRWLIRVKRRNASFSAFRLSRRPLLVRKVSSFFF